MTFLYVMLFSFLYLISLIVHKLKFDKPIPKLVKYESVGPVPYYVNFIVDFVLIAILASNGWMILAFCQILQTIANEIVHPIINGIRYRMSLAQVEIKSEEG